MPEVYGDDVRCESIIPQWFARNGYGNSELGGRL